MQRRLRLQVKIIGPVAKVGHYIVWAPSGHSMICQCPGGPGLGGNVNCTNQDIAM